MDEETLGSVVVKALLDVEVKIWTKHWGEGRGECLWHENDAM